MTTATPVLHENDVEVAHAEERALVERIAASRHFAKSGLLTRFLRYICERHFAGREGELAEQHIGVHVFGRAAGYDCGADNIVRNYARQLRNRLEDFYRWEGQAESLRLDVPRGAYKPVFLSIPPPLAVSPAIVPRAEMAGAPAVLGIPANDAAARKTANRGRRTWLLLIIVFSAMLAIALLMVRFVRSRGGFMAMDGAPMHSFWSSMFRPDRDTVIVTADSGFGTLQDMLGRRLSLADYTGLGLGTLPLSSPEHYLTGDMASQRYTSMVDLETAVVLSHLPEAVPNRLSIRFARDLRMEDLKDNNVILLGSAYTNPWSLLFARYKNFALEGEVGRHRWAFRNQHPAPGEAALYQGERDGASHRTYATVTWAPNIDHNGHVLMLEGLDMAGTQAAAQSLFHGNALAELWRQTSACHTGDASFEALLGSTSIGSSAGPIEVLATRHHC